MADASTIAAPGNSASTIQRAAWIYDGICISCLTVLAAVLRCAHLSAKSFWFDEGVSVAIARLDWYNFLRILGRREANMTLYYLLLRPWLLLGHSEAFVRALSVIFGVAAIPAIYFLGKEIYNRQAGLIAAALLTVNALHIDHSQEARSYPLFVLLSILSTYFFWRSMKVPSRQNLRWHIMASVLAVYAHFFATLLLAVQWCWIRLRGMISPAWKRNWLWIVIFSAPLFVFIVTTGAGPLAWIPRPGWQEVSRFLTALTGNAGWPLVTLYCVAIVIVIIFLRQKPSTEDRGATQFLLFWLFAPILLIFLISQLRSFFLTRYFLFLLPPLLLLAARGIQYLPRTSSRLLALVLFLALSWQGLRSSYAHDLDVPREDWRQASAYVLNHAQPGDALVFHTLMGRMPFEFYRWDARGPIVVAPRHADKITYQDFLGRPDRKLLESLVTKHPRVWVVLSHNERGLGQAPDDTTAMIREVLRQSYQHEWEAAFVGVDVLLYDKPIAATDPSVTGEL